MSAVPAVSAPVLSPVEIVDVYGCVLFTSAPSPLDAPDRVRKAVEQAAAAAANLRGANLRGANLCGANLCGADLCGANLRGANLRGADLYGVKVKRLITSVPRSDGYVFFAFEKEEGGVFIAAGCQSHHGTDSYRKHVGGYSSKEKADETLAILAFIDARAAQPASWY